MNLEESLKIQSKVIRAIRKAMGLLDDSARAAVIQWFHQEWPAKGPGVVKS